MALIKVFEIRDVTVCASSARILWIQTESRLSSHCGVSGFRLVGIPAILTRSGWFVNHSKSFIHFSYVICAFSYRILELVFVLSYIWSRVWGEIKCSGAWCGDYYLIPRRLTALIRQKFLDSAVNEVSKALSMTWHLWPYELLWYPQEWQSCQGFIIHHVAGPVRWVPPYLASL
jgi:hypothetical protein